MGLINWCDEKITELKDKGIKFKDGIPIVPIEMRYDGIPKMIETYQFRNEIPLNDRKESLISFYSFEDRLWNRLLTIDEDCIEFHKFGGITGMDISPSVNMLRPRQMHSILINNIYDCLVAVRGVKVAINARIGDLKTNTLMSIYPKGVTIVFGNVGCKGIFAEYSIVQFNDWIDTTLPSNICIYGTFGEKDRARMYKLKKDLVLHLYRGHNFGNVENKKSVLIIRSNEYTKNNPCPGYVYEYILDHGRAKINTFDELSSKGGGCHGC